VKPDSTSLRTEFWLIFALQIKKGGPKAAFPLRQAKYQSR